MLYCIKRLDIEKGEAIMSKYEVILDVYKTCSFSVTAERFNYTQSAVSQIVKNYEKKIGIPLFKRKRNKIEPLANTKHLMKELEKICAAERKILEIAKSLNSLDFGFLRIGTIQSIAYHWLPYILRDFSKRFANIKFEVYVYGFSELNEMLLKNELDLIFTSGFAAKNFDFFPLGQDELCLVTPLKHRLSQKESISFSDIGDYNYISTADKLDYETGQLFIRYGIHPNVQYELNEDFSALKMVEAGFGVTVLPKLLVKDAPFKVSVRSFKERFTRILGVACLSEDNLSPAANVFIAYARKWYEADRQNRRRGGKSEALA